MHGEGEAEVGREEKAALTTQHMIHTNCGYVESSLQASPGPTYTERFQRSSQQSQLTDAWILSVWL